MMKLFEFFHKCKEVVEEIEAPVSWMPVGVIAELKSLCQSTVVSIAQFYYCVNVKSMSTSYLWNGSCETTRWPVVRWASVKDLNGTSVANRCMVGKHWVEGGCECQNRVECDNSVAR